MMLIDWDKFVLLLLPVRLRTASLLALFRVCVSPIVTIYNDLLNYSSNVNYKLDHTYQVWSIKAVLNDRFDTVERRIYIQDTDGLDAVFLQMDDDQLPVMVDDDTHCNFWLHPDSSYISSGFDCVIILPYAFPDRDIYELKALVNFYKLIGIKYDIVVIETGNI